MQVFRAVISCGRLLPSVHHRPPLPVIAAGTVADSGLRRRLRRTGVQAAARDSLDREFGRFDTMNGRVARQLERAHVAERKKEERLEPGVRIRHVSPTLQRATRARKYHALGAVCVWRARVPLIAPRASLDR